ncbi:hypothetical protein ACQ86N_23955 [Puia sp. P3]|uniref:hypothetical protein n=1 Tax=Puia sp. P3 TaxID=3423952 RepID=UPI003D67ECED
MILLAPVWAFCQPRGKEVDSALAKVDSLAAVTVAGRKLPVERKQGKTIINVEASVTNTGSTVLEVLEKSPGVTVDRNGG